MKIDGIQEEVTEIEKIGMRDMTNLVIMTGHRIEETVGMAIGDESIEVIEVKKEDTQIEMITDLPAETQIENTDAIDTKNLILKKNLESN